MKIVLLDTYYDAFLKSLPSLTEGYDAELAKLMDLNFGASFYGENLRALGHECIDIVANYEPLQKLWMAERGIEDDGKCLRRVMLQVRECRPDVVFLQDLNFPDFRNMAGDYLLAGQCSCPMPKEKYARNLELVFTSFPHYVEKFRSLGVPRVEYLPLAFDPRMLKYASQVRDIDISFVGGVGRDSHWRAGTDVLEAVAARFGARFRWFGYGLENLSPDSPLRACYKGSAWGAEMYRVYARSKCVVNRHGEIANGFTNNLRVFEATGMGALLFTEHSKNLEKLFGPAIPVGYSSAKELCDELEWWLDNENLRPEQARAAQQWTRLNHTYAQRMETVSRVLSECLERRKVTQ